jgi:hypothetical protein
MEKIEKIVAIAQKELTKGAKERKYFAKIQVRIALLTDK